MFAKDYFLKEPKEAFKNVNFGEACARWVANKDWIDKPTTFGAVKFDSPSDPSLTKEDTPSKR